MSYGDSKVRTLSHGEIRRLGRQLIEAAAKRELPTWAAIESAGRLLETKIADAQETVSTMAHACGEAGNTRDAEEKRSQDRIASLEIANSALVRTLTIVRDAEIDCTADGNPMMPRVVFHEVCRAIQLGRGSLPETLSPEPIGFFCPQGPGQMHQWRERCWQTEDLVHMHAMVCACGAEWGREPNADASVGVDPFTDTRWPS